MASPVILTPDQRVRVFISSTLGELAAERAAVRRAIESLHLLPVLFEAGARPHPPRSLYRAYLEQSDVFVGLYWQRYGWVAPGMEVSGLEDEYLLSGGKPRLVYVKRPAPEQEEGLAALLGRIRAEGDVSYRAFGTAAELERLVADDPALLLSEMFQAQRSPAPHGDERPRNRLPSPPTAFVGRADELAQLRKLIGRGHLVTLTGPGGIGKTRLAVQLAFETAADFPDGAAFVGLAALQGPELVAATVAQALGVREEGPERPLEALKDHLAERRLLLVLDNFEHLLPAATVVTELIAAAPGVALVVTSREALRVLAEHEFPVSSLTAADAVTLFVRRAEAVRHDFAVDDTSAALVDRIVAALEGVPLAIELAAARVRILPPQAILERLDRHLDFLAGGARDLPERQRALRSTMDWSYDLLVDDDQRLFARVGVFAGSFSLAAAEAVCDPCDQLDVLAGLASLVDKSLLRAEPVEGEPRFRMLIMVRDYAREKLEASGEREAVTRRHAEFYRELSRELGVSLRGPDQARWVERLERGTGAGDIDNVRAALRWYIDHGELDHVDRIVWSLWLLGWVSGRLEECHRWAREALSAPGALARGGRARLLTVAGLFEMWKGEYAASMSALTEAVTIARGLRDDDVLANSLLGLGLASAFVEGMQTARSHAEEAHALFRAHGDRVGAGDLVQRAHVVPRRRGRLRRRRRRLRGGARDRRGAGRRPQPGHDPQQRRRVPPAPRAVRRGGAPAGLQPRPLPRPPRHVPSSYAIDAAARLAARTGRPETAAVLLGAADGVRATIGVPVEGAHRVRRARLVEHVRAELGSAAFDEALAQGRGLRHEQAVDAAIDAVTAGLTAG